MNSEGKLEFLQGQFLKNRGLAKLNQYLAKNNQNFQFGQIVKPTFQINQQIIGIVISGTGTISEGLQSEFELNDILLIYRGKYSINSDEFKILTVTGPSLFKSSGIIKQANFPILPSTLGGTRKLLKADEGKFNIDIHLIWVDVKNVKIPHYHKRLFELYLVEEGVGEILLKKGRTEKWQAKPELKPGVFVLVPPNTVHCAQGENLEIAVVGIPAFYYNDSFKVGN